MAIDLDFDFKAAGLALYVVNVSLKEGDRPIYFHVGDPSKYGTLCNSRQPNRGPERKVPEHKYMYKLCGKCRRATERRLGGSVAFREQEYAPDPIEPEETQQEPSEPCLHCDGPVTMGIWFNFGRYWFGPFCSPECLEATGHVPWSVPRAGK